MTGAWKVLPLLAVVAMPSPAAAQAVAPGTPGPARSELAVTVGVVGPVSFGTAEARLTTPGGSSLVLFETESRQAAGTAVELHLGQQITDGLMVEATGLWNRADFKTRVSNDIEDAEPVTLARSSSRFAVIGAAVWTIREGARMSWFARGGGGWMREVAGTGALVKDGAIISAGGGVKYWFVDRPGARIRRIGIRVEGRAEIRTAALTLGERRARVAPVVVGGVAFRF